MIGDALNTAQSISNFGMLAVTAGFFLVLSAVLMVTCFKWFMRVINNTMDNQKKAMEELVTNMSFEGIKNICLGMVIRLLNSLHLILRYMVKWHKNMKREQDSKIIVRY